MKSVCAMADPFDLATAEGVRDAVASLDPDFQGLLERKELEQIVQARLGNVGVRSISRFSVIGEANGDVRTFAVDHLRMGRGSNCCVGRCLAGSQDTDVCQAPG